MAIFEITADLDSAVLTPVEISLPSGMTAPDGPLQLEDMESGAAVPAQMDGETLVALLPGASAGMSRRFRLAAAAAPQGRVQLKEEGPHTLAIILPDGPFTAYNFDPKEPRPFFFPVHGPGGKRVTRSYPMQDVAGEERDHPHHRSFWTAYGEVNGVDDWSQMPNHGWIKHQKFTEKKEGAAFGGFTATSVWTDKDGKPILDERRTIKVYNAGPERRLLDYDVELTASYADLHYGDTKEGGILAFRVASSMDGKRGGRIENSSGGVSEKECWGKRANWLDYSGAVEGGEILGIGMMDHPGNLNYPCYWHARDYGLVGTNPFAKGSFEKELPKDGHHQKKGQKLLFRYRVLIHRGSAKAAGMDDAYHAWVQGPKGKASS